jgi:hypothetical protein
MGKEEDDLQYMRSEFMADPDDFSSLRSETLMDDLRVGNDQLSEPEDKVTPKLSNVSSRPKGRPLRDLL